MSAIDPSQSPETPQTPQPAGEEPKAPEEQKPAIGKYSSFQVLIVILTVMGLFTILSAIISLVGALLGSVSGILMEDVIFNIVFGALVFLAARVLARRKVMGLWIFTGSILLSLAYELIMNRGLNYIVLLFGALVAWQLLSLQKRGEIR